MGKRQPLTPFLFAGLVASGSPLTLANSGEALYAEHCATCHSASLRGSAHGAALTGPAFSEKWSEQSASDLLAYQMQEMPPGAAGSLSIAQHKAITEHVISQSALADTVLLKTTVAELQSVEPDTPDAVEFSGAGSVMDLARNAGAYSMRKADQFRSVTTEELNAPAPGDWLNWRRTPDGHSHSPLAQITRDNVGQLSLSWSMAMHSGSNQPTPLVRDGVMFLTTPTTRFKPLMPLREI